MKKVLAYSSFRPYSKIDKKKEDNQIYRVHVTLILNGLKDIVRTHLLGPILRPHCPVQGKSCGPSISDFTLNKTILIQHICRYDPGIV